MIIKLSKNQFCYLKNHILNYKEISKYKSQIEMKGLFIYLNIDENTAENIRDRSIEKLQKKGFNINYELTSEGNVLEELIDLFYQ